MGESWLAAKPSSQSSDQRADAVAGIDVVGPLPCDLQQISLFAAAIFTAAKPRGWGEARFVLAQPELAPILARKGLSLPQADGAQALAVHARPPTACVLLPLRGRAEARRNYTAP